MKVLVMALFLIAAGYTGLVFYLVYGWRHELPKIPMSDLLGIGLYTVPIMALWAACIALWKVSKRPQL